MKIPKLSLVGAGPGDPELITLKGLKAIEEADVILYDALANPQLLDYRKENCRIVFVGKRAGLHKFNQEEINRLIVKHAYESGHVVRLKGGDPFIFGRGFEELEYAALHGLEIAVVPGLSSAMAVPAVNLIPATARHINESVRIVTASTKKHVLCEQLTHPLPESQTLIILMGIKWLPEICHHFIGKGQGHYPMAIIRNGSLPTQQVLSGTIEELSSAPETARLASPAIIIIGQVVLLREKLQAIQNREQLSDNIRRTGH